MMANCDSKAVQLKRTYRIVKKPVWLLLMMLAAFSLTAIAQNSKDSHLEHFITRQGSDLFDGEQVFRFAGIHAPELHRIEDDARGKCLADPRGWGQFFKWPTPEEQENWIQSLVQTGHKAMRIYVLSVAHSTDEACGRETHILPPHAYSSLPTLNENAMQAYDNMIALADKHGLRLILPFIDHWQWWGGREALAAFYNEPADALYDTQSQTFRAYQEIIRLVINRKNTITGRFYHQEKAIMAWETGNELKGSTTSFVAKTAALIKAYAPNQLVVDGNYLSILPESLNNPHVDIITNHFYSVNGNNKPKTIEQDLTTIAGKKAYMVGEFGLLPVPQLTDIMAAVVNTRIPAQIESNNTLHKEHRAVGAFIWGMRGRRHNGGFYWHREGDSGHSSYHLPGFVEGDGNQEQAVINLVRQVQSVIATEQSFTDSNKTPALPKPDAPTLRSITQNRQLQWLGSPTGKSYRIERRLDCSGVTSSAKRENTCDGHWHTLASNISDGKKEYNPSNDSLFTDSEHLPVGTKAEYRVIAVNQAGESTPSAIQALVIAEPDPTRFVQVQNGQLFRYGKPYYFAGTNYWFGPILGATPEGRKRLVRELDQLKAHGITNLRVLVGAESDPAASPDNSVIKPALQTKQGKYNQALLTGLDVLLAEMDKRDMQAVLYMNNNWIWSGGYSQYLNWNGYGDIVNPFDPEHEWQDYMDFAGQFYHCQACISHYHQHIRFIMSRVNSVSGKPYVDDATIMSWQLANEPRIFNQNNIAAFRQWLHTSASLIKSLAPNQLVSTGSEGKAGSLNQASVFAQMHQHPSIDYLTMHAWPKNWSWFDPERPKSSLRTSINNAKSYLQEHMEVARTLNKPIVLSEFGFPRNNESLSPDSSVFYRNQFYQAILDNVINSYRKEDVLAGMNFWAYGGFGKANKDGDGKWQQGDDYLGDPAQEPQGLNTVFATDTSTLKLMKNAAQQLSGQHQ